MSFIKFDVNAFNKIVKDASDKLNSKTAKTEYTKTSYMPEGTHTLTFFFDPDQEIIRDVQFHKPKGSKIKCLCPNRLNKDNERNPKWAETVQAMKAEWADEGLKKLPPCEICSINSDAQQLDIDKFGDVKKGKSWKEQLGVDYKTLMYVNLYETTVPGEYWKPDPVNGTPYVVIGTSKLKQAVVKMLETYSKNERARSEMIAALNPSVRTPPCEVAVTRGTQGGVLIQRPPADEKPPIIESAATIPAWWRPLNKVFIGETFILEDYEMNVKAAQETYQRLEAEYSGQPDVPPTPAEDRKPAQDKNPLQIRGGEAESFLASKGIDDVKIPEAKQSDVMVRTAVEDVKPLTSTEETAIDDGALKPNQRLSSMNNVVTLPAFAVERQCWGKYDEADVLCMKCPAALDCSFE